MEIGLPNNPINLPKIKFIKKNNYVFFDKKRFKELINRELLTQSYIRKLENRIKENDKIGRKWREQNGNGR